MKIVEQPVDAESTRAACEEGSSETSPAEARERRGWWRRTLVRPSGSVVLLFVFCACVCTEYLYLRFSDSLLLRYPVYSCLLVPPVFVLLRTAWIVQSRERAGLRDDYRYKYAYVIETLILLLPVCLSLLFTVWLGAVFGLEVSRFLYQTTWVDQLVAALYGIIFAGMTLATWAPSFLHDTQDWTNVNFPKSPPQRDATQRNQPHEKPPDIQFGLGTVFAIVTFLCINLALLGNSVVAWLGVNAVFLFSLFPAKVVIHQRRVAGETITSNDRLSLYWSALWPRLAMLYTSGLAINVTYKYFRTIPYFRDDGGLRAVWTSAIAVCWW